MTSDAGTLAGRTVLVTGAGRGIGRAVALRLAREGASVAALDLEEALAQSTASELEAAGARALAVAADVSDPSQVVAAVRRVEAALGAVDVLVNVAGIYGRLVPLREQDLESWNRVLGVNLHGTFLCTKAVLPGMVERGWGRVVNVASGQALRPKPTVGPYAASKAAVIGFTKALALEVARQGVTVNAIMPGTVDTSMPRQHRSEESLRQVGERNPSGRIARPEDVAAVAAFLASPEASYVTGQTVAVNGGVVQLP